MLYFPKYAGSLRCIGQALQAKNVEVFEVKSIGNDYLVQYGDPNPPHTGIVELQFSSDSIKILDREGQARRRQTGVNFRFDSVAEILRVVGEHIDEKRAYLRRVTNCCLPNNGDVQVEYETRAGVIQSEILTMSFIRETGVRMYKRRTRLSNPIEMITR